MTKEYNNPKHLPGLKPKHKLDEKEIKRLSEKKEAKERAIKTYYGGLNIND